LLRHIFAVAGTLRVPLSQPQKRHIQPERYAKRTHELIINAASMPQIRIVKSLGIDMI